MRPTTQVTGKENDMTKARIDGVELKISEREPLLAGTVGLNKISLSFSDEWAIFTKQIDFTNEQSGETRRISAEVGVCTVPWELLRSEGDITCYVRGIGSDGSLVLRTNEANLGTVLGSADGNVPGTGTPTPDVCDETAAKIGDLSKLETDEKSQLVGAINEVKRKADNKQDKLTAGDNITIAENGTISSTGGGAEVFFLDVFVMTETEVITNKTYAEIDAAIDAGSVIYITNKDGVVFMPQVAKTNALIEILWLDSTGIKTQRWSAIIDSKNAWSVTVAEFVDIDRMVSDLRGKVDKVTGKGLSTNDYTYADKAKVNAIPASPKYTDTVYDDTAVKNRLTAVENEVAGIEAGSGSGSGFSGSYNDLTDKPTIPAAVTEGTVSGWGFTKNTGTYSKPTGGIPKDDLAHPVLYALEQAAEAEVHTRNQTRHITDEERTAWNAKQDKLIAGTNITIAADGKTVSVAGGITPLTGTTAGVSPRQVYQAILAGTPVVVKYTDGTYGELSFTNFNVADEFMMIVSQTIVYFRGSYVLAELAGSLGGEWVFFSTSLARTDDIPKKTSQLTNDSGFLTGHQDISGKVDKVTGKGLSTNDYTAAAKAKVDAIPANPKYTDTVYNDTAVKNRLTAIEDKENVTLTANTARITNVSYTAKYFPLLGMVFVRIYGKICADLNAGYDYDLFSIDSRVPDSNTALSVKCGKDAMGLAKTSSSGSAIQIRPLESGINGYDVYITGFWFA